MKRFFIFALFLFFAVLFMIEAASAQIIMKGRVTNAKDEVFVGALVEVADTDIALLTNNDGEFELNIPEEHASGTVIVHYVGFRSVEVPVTDGFVNVELNDRPVQEVDEITVSTQKRMQTEVDVPIALTVMPVGKISAYNFGQIDEMSFFIPGFQINIQDYSTGVYGIRGVCSDGMESYFQQRISVYQDNVSIGRLQTSVIEPFDLARVEVVKGPQGTLFGRGALVGAVHYVRNKPVREFDVRAMVDYGAYNQRGGELMLNTPWGRRVANRLALRYDAHDGYINNLAGGRANGKEAIAIKNATSFFINDSSTVTLTLDLVSNSNPSTSFKTNHLGTPGDPKNTSPYKSAYFNGGDSLGLDRKVYSGIIQYDGHISNHLSLSNTIGLRYYESDLGFDVDGSYMNILFGVDRAKGHQISEELRLNWDNGRNLSGFFGMSYVYEFNEHQYLFSGTMNHVYPLVIGPRIRKGLHGVPEMIGSTVASMLDVLGAQIKAQVPELPGQQIDDMVSTFKPLARDGVINNLNKLYDRLYLKSDTWDESPDLAGESANVVNEVLSTHIGNLIKTNPQVGALLRALLGNASVEDFVKSFDVESQLRSVEALSALSKVPVPDDYHENATDKCKTKEVGIFADLTWNFYRNFYLTVGLRGTDESMETGYLSSSDKAPIVGQSLLLYSSDGQQLWTERKYRSWVGRAVANWKFDSKHNLYLSASKGRRPALVYYDLRPDVVVELCPEHLYNYELGIKGISRNGYFNYNVANYYYTWHHFQSSEYGTRGDADGSVGYITNDKGRARGFGLDGSLLYTFNKKLSTFIDYTFCNGRFSKKDMDNNDQELRGNRFRLNPEHKFDIGFNISPQLANRNLYLHIHPLVAIVGKSYFSEPNVAYLRQDAYVMANLNVGLRFARPTGRLWYDVSLYGKNLLNSKYCVDAGNSGDVFGYPTYVAGAPVTYGVVIRTGLMRIQR